MKQHTKPCKTCPFSRTVTPGELGGSPATTFIGQAFGAFWLPCHEFTDYKDPNWKTDYSRPQCAGAAIYRSNCHPAIRPPMLLNLPADSDTVFTSPAEFISHHERISISQASDALGIVPPNAWWIREMLRPTKTFTVSQPKKEPTT